MNSSLRQFDRTLIVRIPTSASTRVVSNRTGFTMIELLIAVSILVILTTLTVSAFNVNDADRVSNSIGTFKNALEGARSRAINSGEVRGLRLIVDANDPRMVKSMVYIGSAGTLEGELTIGGYNSSANRYQVTDTSNDWRSLGNGQRALIKEGSRIEIPANSGRWYTVAEPPLNSTDDNMLLSGIFTPGEWIGTSYIEIPSGANFSYRLELEPTVLDGAEPILLDPQTCIDLDGSRVPGRWRNLEDRDGDRMFDDTSMGAVDVDVDGDGQFDYVGAYNANQMQILFAPDGTLTGTSKTSGIMSFRFAYVSDVVLFQGAREISQSSSFPAYSNYSLFMMPANPEKEHKALTIFPQTGGIVITDIDPTTSGTAGGFNSNLASQPFSYALLGKESN